MIAADSIVGRGGATVALELDEMRAVLHEALAGLPAGARLLAIVPDRTRDDNTHQLFPLASEILAAKKVARFDAIIAQGTHPPMTEAQKLAKIGADGVPLPSLGNIFDHDWNRDDALTTLGSLSAARVRELTAGLLTDSIPVRLNAHLKAGEYDFVLVFGATTPHEVAGFAGGAKYFFPGVAGPELTHMTHWLGALASIENVIGRVETPVRHLIEAAADLVPAKIISINSVVTRDAAGLDTRALFAGDFRLAFRRAAEVSAQVHIRYTPRRYRRVLALLDEHYDELWVGGKASYKLGGIIETGGELIIFAPNLKEISATHGRLIEKYGYAPLEQVRDMVEGSEELRANLAVAAHLAHVSYAGARNSQGRVTPRFSITLATGIPEDVCRRVKLGYRDWRAVDRREFELDPDALVVENAGRDLYLVQN
ncbi:MAG TPA: lactate racemase domain-containing protein [Candidatus Acidoferrales bacterium]|nr:lactate racemase domain-containing protein [Candidatus Acidoferrales bacterium]